jgi:hypothetical protein
MNLPARQIRGGVVMNEPQRRPILIWLAIPVLGLIVASGRYRPRLPTPEFFRMRSAALHPSRIRRGSSEER